MQHGVRVCPQGHAYSKCMQRLQRQQRPWYLVGSSTYEPLVFGKMRYWCQYTASCGASCGLQSVRRVSMERLPAQWLG
jgi:hypothetical protein